MKKYILNTPTALVLEGGGMRCVFTAGVLDAFMDYGVTFPYTIGASGGASGALSYYSNQRGRTHYINITIMQMHPYMGWRSLLRNGRLVDLPFLFNDVPDRLSPFDFDTFSKSKDELEIVTTNCITGDPHYNSIVGVSNEQLLSVGQASSSLPVLCSAVDVDGIAMLDGGLSDSIPYDRAMSRGYNTVLVVSTQNFGFRKRIPKRSIPSFILRKYPKVRELLTSRPARYNAQLERLEKLENESIKTDGNSTINVSVLRPIEPIKVGRFTSNLCKLQELYDRGYEIGENWLKANCHIDND